MSESRDFHPTDVMEDADGSLLVVDTGAWYKLCCPTSQMEKPDVLGGIYRIRRRGASPPPDPRGVGIGWVGLKPEELAGLLDDSRPAVRSRAIRELARAEALPSLRDSLSEGSPAARLNAVWALTRIEGDAARDAVRAGLADETGDVRLAALHSVALHRDAEALDAAMGLLDDPSARVRRGAAEALGRIGDPRAVAPLLAAAGSSGDDEVLAHSLVYALIEIADPRATSAGLRAGSTATQRAAMIALDQMRPPALDGRRLLTWLEDPAPEIAKAARWIAGRHPEWGGLLAGYLGDRLGAAGEDSRDGLGDLLAGFATHPRVQRLLAEAVERADRPGAARLALEAMAVAPVDAAPERWPGAVAAALGRDATRQAALRAGQSLPRGEDGLPILDRALVGVARDSGLDGATRVRALDAGVSGVSSLNAELFDLAVGEVLASRPVEARAAAARVLSAVPLDDAQLLVVAGLLPEVGPMELPPLVEAFGQSGVAAVGASLVAGLEEAAGLSNVRADQAERATARYGPTVRDAVDALLAGEVGGLESQRANLDRLLRELESGDAIRGQAVFNSSEAACLACHAIGDAGGAVGPELTRIGQIRERRDLLEAIVYPSASFVRSYEPVVAVTGDGEVSGVIVEDAGDQVVIAVNADERVRLARSEIEEVRPGTVSVMPSGLDGQFSEGEIADLLAFLEATQWGPVGPRR